MLLINYDTEDTTAVISRNQCGCGRTHMRIYNPQREAETVWVYANSINSVDIEAAVCDGVSPCALRRVVVAARSALRRGLCPDLAA